MKRHYQKAFIQKLLLADHLIKCISVDKITDGLNCDKNDLGYEEFMDDKIIQMF